jgi:hypothetical protein
MSKRKAFWLLLASGIVLQFNCIPSFPQLLGQSSTLLTSLVTRLPANIQPIVNALINLLPKG